MITIRAFPADQSGCGFYRIIEPARVVADQSPLEVQVVSNDGDERALEVTLQGRLGQERVIKVADPGCDVVILQRPAHRHLVEVIPLLQAHGVTVIAEFDDDFNTIDPRNVAWAAYEPTRSPQSNKVWAARAAELADLVTVSTDALARRYGAHGRVVVLPNYVPQSYLELDIGTRWWKGTTIGWAGNPDTHPGDLEVLGMALPELLSRRGDAWFHTIGTRRTLDVLGLASGMQATAEDWTTLARYPERIAHFDIGLAPLEDTAFNRAKSWLKPLEYAAVGVPCIASPLAEYKKLGISEFVYTTAKNQRVWRQAMERLLDDPDLRGRGEAARDAVKGFTYEAHAYRWVEAWTNAIALHRAHSAS